jgi:hypothetical protein
MTQLTDITKEPPDGSEVIDRDGDHWTRKGDHWFINGEDPEDDEGNTWNYIRVYAPLTLYIP